MIGLGLPNGADFAWFHIWWLVLVATVMVVVKATWYRAPLDPVVRADRRTNRRAR